MIEKAQRTEDDMSDILELRFTCYLANHNTAAQNCGSLLPLLANRPLTPKLHILAAEAHILQNATHSPAHPAIPHLLDVLRLYPTAVELAEKLLLIGASIDTVLSHIPQSAAKLFMQSLQFTSRSEYDRAISVLNNLSHSVVPAPVCVLNGICINANNSHQYELFDNTAALIPMDDLEIVDLRANRLRVLKKSDELNQIVLLALNSDEDNANAWLAFSHLLQLNGDNQRALQSTRKALLLDRGCRRGFMRLGRLRMMRKDLKKALASFKKAHQLHEGMDSYGAIVKCLCEIEDWPQAEAYAMRAAATYPVDGEHGGVSLALTGLALRGRDVGRAVKTLRRALEKGGAAPDALAALLELRLKDNDVDGAEALLREFRKDAGEFYYFLKMADIAGRRRDFQKAMDHVTNALRLEPGNDEAQELREELERMNRDNDSDGEVEEDVISF
jgi:tetratricopeptide (TPR) repeat protein